jgi:multidrug resistance efflux pump
MPRAPFAMRTAVSYFPELGRVEMNPQNAQMPPSNIDPSSFEVIDTLQALLAESRPKSASPAHPAGFDLNRALESLRLETQDLEKTLEASKEKVSGLASCYTKSSSPLPAANSPRTQEPIAETNPSRSVFSVSFLSQWLDAFAKLVGGQAGVVIMNDRRKVLQSQYIGWDSAPFRVHSELLNKACAVSLGRSTFIRSSHESQDNADSTLCVTLNRLSRNVGHVLILKSIELPKSKGYAVLLIDSAQVDLTLAEKTVHSVEFQNLINELDTWFLIRRFQWCLRVAETKKWLISRPKLLFGVLALMVLGLLSPVPYYPTRDCIVEPETRQIVSSPLAGRIMTCEVRTGDTVSKGQLLARLDDEQIQREYVSAQAELERASKKFNSSLALRAQGEAGLAKMDILRAEAKVENLKSQLSRTEVRASTAGIVTQGDWHKNLGMPVTLGQSLFEIAQLSTLTAEVHLTAEDLGQIRVGDKVAIRSDATGRDSFYGTIGRIEPRATVKDDQAYFTADVIIEDSQQRLRPGMKASAQVSAGWRSIGWLLFSRPYRWLSNQWIW